MPNNTFLNLILTYIFHTKSGMLLHTMPPLKHGGIFTLPYSEFWKYQKSRFQITIFRHFGCSKSFKKSSFNSEQVLKNRLYTNAYNYYMNEFVDYFDHDRVLFGKVQHDIAISPNGYLLLGDITHLGYYKEDFVHGRGSWKSLEVLSQMFFNFLCPDEVSETACCTWVRVLCICKYWNKFFSYASQGWVLSKLEVGLSLNIHESCVFSRHSFGKIAPFVHLQKFLFENGF